jgi:hypothetical protein
MGGGDRVGGVRGGLSVGVVRDRGECNLIRLPAGCWLLISMFQFLSPFPGRSIFLPSPLTCFITGS